MPGILPMKVIKIGSNAQSRIAQACDRCRSKKIRCDGIRPTCTQCLNVGFECKTSDKLSRRAFPRGYTESLEERVRALETEVRELKGLLDEKDEKIDMLSRIHSFSSAPSARSPQAHTRCSRSFDAAPDTMEPREVDRTFSVDFNATLQGGRHSSLTYSGSSSSRSFVDSFKRRVQQRRGTTIGIGSEAFSPVRSNSIASLADFEPPARLLTDQLVNIYFQEWAPLFPVFHRPSFLVLYTRFVEGHDAVESPEISAQLYLVFSIAALSNESHSKEQVDSWEQLWQWSIEGAVAEDSIDLLQVLVLAQIYCLQKADYGRLSRYRGGAVALAQRLGLHQSQASFQLDTIAIQTRKKLFWTLYMVDCFAAAQLGLPTLIKDADVCCEYPTDSDDEYVTEKGFSPSLPGESTKLSSAIALFKASRILHQVLQNNFATASTREISFRKISELSNQLEEWQKALPSHLTLQFIQDKPSTHIITSRSPLLSLAYHYIKSLIYRPLVCAGESAGEQASSATVTLAECSKHILQIVQLLEERTMSFSFCVNKCELLLVCGFSLFYQVLDLDHDGAMMKDQQRSLAAISSILGRQQTTMSVEFRRLSSWLALTGSSPSTSPTLSRASSNSNSSVEESIRSAQRQMKAIAQKQIRAITSRVPFISSKTRNDSVADSQQISPGMLSTNWSSPSVASLGSVSSEPSLDPRRDSGVLSPHMMRNSLSPQLRRQPAVLPQSISPQPRVNLDYLAFGNESTPNLPTYNTDGPTIHRTRSGNVSATDWQRILASMDCSQNNIYDTIYGGLHAATDASTIAPQKHHHHQHQTLPSWATNNIPPSFFGTEKNRPSTSPSATDPSTHSPSTVIHLPHGWTLGYSPSDGEADAKLSPGSTAARRPCSSTPGVPASVLSFSDESLTSGGEEFADLAAGFDTELFGFPAPEEEGFAETGCVGGGLDSIMIPALTPREAGGL